MIVIAPFAVKWGRRPVFILGVLCLFLCSIWSGASTNIDSFKWSRIFQGFGMAPFEALVVSTFGDVFFIDQRGLRSAIWGFAILAGINVTPIINGYIISSKTLGWKWCFWLIAIFYGIAVVLIVLLCPETAFNRNSVYDTDDGQVTPSLTFQPSTLLRTRLRKTWAPSPQRSTLNPVELLPQNTSQQGHSSKSSHRTLGTRAKRDSSSLYSGRSPSGSVPPCGGGFSVTASRLAGSSY